MPQSQSLVMESWYVQKDDKGRLRLCGRVFNHPTHSDNTKIQSSAIARACFTHDSHDRILITESGKTYVLGKHSEHESPEQSADLIRTAEISSKWGGDIVKQIMALKTRMDIPDALKRSYHVPAPQTTS